jgi:hypothetical protein
MIPIKYATVVCMLLSGLTLSASTKDGPVTPDTINDAQWRANCSPAARPGFLCATALLKQDMYAVKPEDKDKWVWSGKQHCKLPALFIVVCLLVLTGLTCHATGAQSSPSNA